jgi:hypothetical protein
MHTTAAQALRRIAQALRLVADQLDPPIERSPSATMTHARVTIPATTMTHTTPRRIIEGALIFTLAAITAAWRELRTPRGW